MKELIVTTILLASLAVVPWVLSGVYMDSSGVVTTGKVVAKREAFLMPGGDTSKHIFEITCEYQPRDSPYRETVVQRVDAAFFRRHAVGSAVKVRYAPSRLVRSFAGMGLYLEDASRLSRLHYGPPERADLIKTAALAFAVVIGLLAYRLKSRALSAVAALLVGMCFPSVLLLSCALLVFPLLFWAARRNPGKGYGLALLAAFGLCAAVIYDRVPRPAEIPADQLRTGIATVRQVHVVDEIWSDTWETNSHASGDKIGPRYRMVELEFKPEGAHEPIRALDRIDLNSLPGLHDGSVVPIKFSAADLDSVRIVGATHNYSQQLLTYLLGFTYGLGALVTFVFVPLRRVIRRLSSSSRVVRALTDPEAAAARISRAGQWSQLPEEDPRRKAIESAVAALRAARKLRAEDK